VSGQLPERLEAMASGWLCAGLPDADLPREAAAELRRLRAALRRLLDGSLHCGEMQWYGENDESPWQAARNALWSNVQAQARAEAAGRSESPGAQG
jgi:hypothetical protein